MTGFRQTGPICSGDDGSTGPDIGKKDAACAVQVGSDASGIVSARPDRSPSLNCLDDDVFLGLEAVLESCEQNKPARILVLSAAGRHFSAGADIRQLRDRKSGARDAERRRSQPQVLQRLKALPIPTVAALCVAFIKDGASKLYAGDSDGAHGRARSIPAGWSSSMRPGSRPTWRCCTAGGRGASGCVAFLRTATNAR